MGAHHLARKLSAAGLVKPYLKRQKNDAADAEAICEAVLCPSMRFVSSNSLSYREEVPSVDVAEQARILSRFSPIDTSGAHVTKHSRDDDPGDKVVI